LELASQSPETKILNDDKNDSSDYSLPLVSLHRTVRTCK
jgi:hypothetical protein